MGAKVWESGKGLARPREGGPVNSAARQRPPQWGTSPGGITSSKSLCYTAVASSLIHEGFLNSSKSCFRSGSSLTQTFSKQALLSPQRAIGAVRTAVRAIPQVLSIGRPVPLVGSCGRHLPPG